jgi:flagellar basal body-associated protein FliL
VIPWIIIAVVAVPLVVVGYMTMRRNTVAGETRADPNEQARVEQEFAEAEAYEATWHAADKERYHEERLP